jgi:endonuclease-3
MLYTIAMTREEKVKEVIKRLYTLYPHPKTALEFKNPLQLLIATILSAQATDKVVNTITPALFEKYPSAEDFAKASVADIDGMIRKVNFHNNKAKSIHEACKIIAETYQGEVPQTMQELDDLPGVARKTANVVMSGAFHNAQGITVDTHVMRLTHALGLTDAKTPEKVEEDLMKIVPKEYWMDFPHLLILYGREHSPARGGKPGHLLEDLYV